MGCTTNRQRASVLVLVIVALVILTALGLGLLTVSYGVRYHAIMAKNEAVAMLAAEAGYEQAVFRMSQQPDMLVALSSRKFNPTGQLTIQDGTCEYKISFNTFLGSRPIYRIVSTGQCGKFSRTVDVYVLQAVGGWDMGMCRVPSSRTNTAPVYYADGEIIDIPVHINNLKDSPDDRDIYITQRPRFLDPVEMGESRYDGPRDKYSNVMDLFEGGVYFDQPDNRITDEESVSGRVEMFESNTKEEFKFKPDGKAGFTISQDAVQLEFFVESGVGKVRITNNCTVAGLERDRYDQTWDYRIEPGTGGTRYQKYPIYRYHVMPKNAETTGERRVVKIEDTYVSQSFDGVKASPGGQIFVDGNVIIGGDLLSGDGSQILKGKMTVVATGNIWIADAVMVDGDRSPDGIPLNNNPNIMGLVSQGVIRVVDPGLSEDGGKPYVPGNYTYVPVGIKDKSQEYSRVLPAKTIIEASLTVGGGGFGAENVLRNGAGNRKENGIARQDTLILRGTISEAVRGVVGLLGNTPDGYLKHYYLDSRMLEGILPSHFWMKGKYIPAPAGWHDYRI
ncbi:MAG: hypothetical protein WC374_09935 [Phycisphaerae bacterium]|jgi:hypothetical protein